MHEHLRGFNEAVLERIFHDIAMSNSQNISNFLGVSTQNFLDQLEDRQVYYKESKVLNIIISKMAKYFNQTHEEVFQKIKKGFFTGDMMHLRLIEEVFGPGSLRVLAAMGTEGATKDTDEGELYKKIEEFFLSENQEERNRLADDILATRERLAYKKRTGLFKK